jgi:hypothetical protein
MASGAAAVAAERARSVPRGQREHGRDDHGARQQDESRGANSSMTHAAAIGSTATDQRAQPVL